MAQHGSSPLRAVALAGALGLGLLPGCPGPSGAPDDGGLGADAAVLVDGAPSDDAATSDAAPLDLDAAAPDDAPSPSDAAVSPLGCAGARPPWTAPLACVDAPCELLASSELDGAVFRNDRPDIAIGADGEPIVLYTRAQGGYEGWLARRGGGRFTSSRLSFAAASGALAFDAAGCGYAFLNDGAFGAGLFRVEDAGLTSIASHRERMVSGGALALGAGGELFAIGLSEPTTEGFVARFDGAYDERPIPANPGGFSLPGAIAVGRDGLPRLAWIDATASSLVWFSAPGRAPEHLGPSPTSGSRSLHGPELFLALAGDDAPRILYADEAGSVWLARSGAAGFSEVRLADAVPEADCGVPSPGVTCPVRSIRWAPLGLVAAADGDVVGLVSRLETNATLMAECHPGGPGPGGGCAWVSVGATVTPELHLLTAGAGAPSLGLLRAGIGGVSGMLALGPDGHLHAAFYEPTADASSTLVRHVELAPTP